MQSRASTQTSSVDRVLAASLAAVSMFVVGYTATRVYLNQPTGQAALSETKVIPHAASLWSDVGVR